MIFIHEDYQPELVCLCYFCLCSRRFVIGGLLVQASVLELYLIVKFHKIVYEQLRFSIGFK